VHAMALEPRGTEWRNIVPPEVYNTTLSDDDTRTQFICCTMYSALPDKGRYHAKLCIDEVEAQAKACVGKPLVDYHDNTEGKDVGTIIAAGVDKLGRIWVRGALKYNYDGNSVLRKMRNGHYGYVSWRMFTAPTIDPIDRGMSIEKHLLNLAIVSEPEYREAQIFFVADDPPEVKRINAASLADRIAAEAREMQRTERAEKQKPLATEHAAQRIQANHAQSSMSAAAAPTDAAAKPVATVETTATETPKSVAEATKPAVEQSAAPMKVDAPVAASTTIPVPATPTPQTIAVSAAAPPTPVPIVLPQQSNGGGPAIMHFNFGVPAFGNQNQFNAPSNIAAPPTQATPAMATAQPASTPAVPPQDATPAASVPVLTPAATHSDAPTPKSSNKRKADDAGMEETKPTTTVAVPPTTAMPNMEEHLKSFMQMLATATAAAQASQTPVKKEVPATPPTPASTPTPSAKKAKVSFDPMHDAIKRIGQMAADLALEQQKYDNVRDMLQDNEQRLVMERELEAKKARVNQYSSIVVEAFEKHDNEWRKQFGVAPSATTMSELARLKDKIRNSQPLNNDELVWMGRSLEYVSESGARTEALLEERERKVREEYERQRQASAPREDELSAQLRVVLGLDPKQSSSSNNSFQFSNNNNAMSMMPPPQQMKAPVSRAERFRRETGLAWTVLDDSVELKHRPAPPSGTLDMMRVPGFNQRLYPPRYCPDSIFANGLADTDPSFKHEIQSAMSDALKGKEELLTPSDFSLAARAELDNYFQREF